MYHKTPKISPWNKIFQRPFLVGYFYSRNGLLVGANTHRWLVFVASWCWFLFLLFFGNKKSTLKLHGLIFGGFINVFLLEAAMVGALWKFWISAFLEAFKTKFNDSKKKKLFCFVKKMGAMAPLPPSSCTRTLFTYLQCFYFIYIYVQI